MVRTAEQHANLAICFGFPEADRRIAASVLFLLCND
jgi:hypothetical protein